MVMQMKRKIYNELLSWKDNSDKPLIIMGARQVGKTYIIDEFCKNEFENYVSINLFQRRDIVDLYQMRISSDEKFLKLKAYLNFDIEKENTVFFIDEIQESEELISELKYFCEKHNNIKIICSGSLLGIKFKRSHSSFPVGKVIIKKMYPMDFEEFLMAFNELGLIEEIKNCYETNKAMIDALHEKALFYYRLYLCCGGMPACVEKFVQASGDITKYDRDEIKSIVESYFNDMNKYTSSNAESLKIEKIYSSIPSQLLGSANKFQFKKIDDNARLRDYETALDWLLASSMVLKSYQVSNPVIPLKGFIKEDTYKIFLNDIGIFVNNLDILLSDIVIDNLSLYKGVLTESYVASQLVANNNNLYYWESNGIAEIDFLIYNKDGVIPVEVKSSDNTKSKSLQVYMNKYNPKYAIRLSSKNFGFVNGIKSIPLYAVFCMKGEN